MVICSLKKDRGYFTDSINMAYDNINALKKKLIERTSQEDDYI